MGKKGQYKTVKTEERARSAERDVQPGTCKEMSGYKVARWRLYASYALAVVTLGLLPVMFYWKPSWKVRLVYTGCNLKYADWVHITDVYKQTFVERVHIDFYLCDRNSVLSLTTRYFTHKNIKHIWNDELQTFVPLGAFSEKVTCSELHSHGQRGVNEEKHQQLLHLFGPNFIKVPVKPVMWLIFHETLTPFYLFQIYSLVVWCWQGLYMHTSAVIVLAIIGISLSVYETRKAMNPFYVFQLYSSILWYIQEYWMYTTLVVVMSVVSVGVTVWETRRQSKALRNTVKSTGVINVCRQTTGWGKVSTESLVPGDLIEVAPDGVFHCDAALLSGTVIVNESMLTGESVPVTKMALLESSGELFTADTHKRHTIFCGTHVLKTQPPPSGGRRVTALVIRTGFNTSKGELVRSILFPKPVDLKFYSDGMKFMAVSGCLGIIAMIYTTVSYAMNGTPMGELVISALDIITFVVPPSLPATMTIGNLYAQRRLKKEGIFCLSSKYINICGTLNLVCFDKTGTLTKDGLDLYGVISVSNHRFDPLVTRLDVLGICPLSCAMATCHSIIRLDGELTGDPLDLILFQSLGWELRDSTESCLQMNESPSPIIRPAFTSGDYDIRPVHQFTFSSAQQRMSVIVSVRAGGAGGGEDPGLHVYSKGAPEKLKSLCRASSIPADFHAVLNSYTKKGYRVIALAHKALPAATSPAEARKLDRDDVECDLIFRGLAVLRNSLKEETAPVLEKLHHADIRTVMVTGDNLETAVHTSRACGMVSALDDVIIVKAQTNVDSKNVTCTGHQAAPIKVTYELADDNANADSNLPTPEYLKEGKLVQSRYHFACDGNTFALIRSHAPDLFEKLVQRGTVFARMLPEQKGQLVEQFQDLGHTVGMCGDGANDCGALKTANSGVSLSTAEASVAAPFTSSQQHIQCVHTLIQEGRCAVVSSFALFKHLLACSWIFCVAVLVLYSISCDMFDSQYIFLDGVLIIYPTFFFGNMRPYARLVKRPPPQYLADFTAIFSMIGYIVIQMCVIIGVWLYTRAQVWFVPWEYNSDAEFTSYENSMMFLIMCFSFTFSSIIFCRGPPYRKPIYTNLIFSLSMLVILSCVIVINVYAVPFVVKLFGLVYAPTMKFHLILVGICVANFFFSLLFEDFVINRILHTQFLPWLKRKRGPKSKYEVIESKLCRDPDWPPLDTLPRRRNSASRAAYPFTNLFLGVL